MAATSLDAQIWRRRRLAAPLGLSLALSGCMVGPDYVRPEAPTSVKFKEAAPTSQKGQWRKAAPRDALAKGPWWSIYKDAELDRLLTQVELNNQNVAAAVAAYDQSRALTRESQASLLPGVGANWTGQRYGDGRALTSATTGKTFAAGVSYPQGTVSWTLDLWGKIRRQVESNVALTQADAALLANAKLSAQAQLAIAYFNLRGQDTAKRLYQRTAKEYAETLRITQNQYNSGTVSKADLITAQTQLFDVQAQAVGTDILRTQYEHAIAALIGKPPAELSIPRKALPALPPAPPAALPAGLLERRPDVAAAERTMAEQNALIGVAVAAYYPQVTFSAAGGFEGGVAFPFTAAHQIWSIGGAAVDPLFDGGLRAAQVDAGKAVYHQSVANYRQSVLSAFQQVEDELAALRVGSAELRIQIKSRDAAAEAVKVYLNQYRAGTVPFTTVVVAEATLLTEEQKVMAIRQALFVANVTLVEALGGGFDAASLAAEQAPPLLEAIARSSPIPPIP